MRKVAFFLGSLVSEFQEKATTTICEAAKGRFTVDVFAHLGTSGGYLFNRLEEQSMVNIPNLADYDGIIMLPDSLTQDGHYARLLKKIDEEADCPVVSIRSRDSRFHNILTDDAAAMKTVVKHLINVHGLRRIAFMTGRMDLEDAVIRLNSYREAMEENGLEVTEHMVFEGDYWRLKGEEAVNWFLGGDEMPEAIVCSNDYMAISVVEALQNRGIKVPEQIAVTGFDNINESQLAEPRIASMDVPVEKMSTTAVETLERLMNGEEVPKDIYVPITPYFEGSCGCKEHSRADMYRAIYEENVLLNNIVNQSSYMTIDYENCITMEELFNNAFRYSFFFDYKFIYICGCEEKDTQDEIDHNADHYEDDHKLSDRMILQCVIDHDQNSYETPNVHFDRRDIIPKEYRVENDFLIVMSIRSRNMSLGYVVVRTERPDKFGRFFMVWLQCLSSGLEHVKMLGRNQEYLRVKYESRLDPLTGLYNRREMESILRRRRTDKSMNQFYIMALDLDGLKTINDTYGHSMGDVAICAMANILLNIADDKIKTARTGGDEFTICILADNDAAAADVKTRIQEMINEYNEDAGQPFELSASMGYARFNRAYGVNRCINEADKRMYEDKAKRKKERK